MWVWHQLACLNPKCVVLRITAHVQMYSIYQTQKNTALPYCMSANLSRKTWALAHIEHMEYRKLFVQIAPYKKKN